MDLKYKLEDTPPLGQNILFGIQWLAVSLPGIIIMGKLLGAMQGSTAFEILYLQKLFAVIGFSLLIQLFWGHRLPVVVGPSTVLLIGILASQGRSANSIYTSLIVCGLLLFLLAISGVFARLQALFTPRVVAVILLLVAFTITPTIINLISTGQGPWPMIHLGFAFIFIMLMFVGQRFLQGLWKSTLILWAMLVGTLAYLVINPVWNAGLAGDLPVIAVFTQNLNSSLSFDPALLIAFLLCYLGLAINDLGSIQAVGSVLKAPNMAQRLNRGIAATGLANALAGFMGVIGPVNFSFSPGVIASTGCAARKSLVPTGMALIILACLPRGLFYLSFIPSVVIGCILLYIMCTQVASGLLLALDALGESRFDNALLIGLPILTGIIIAFLPPTVVTTFPASLRPILSNGFVVGVLCSLLLEHIIMKPAEE